MASQKFKELNISIGAKLREIRIHKGLTQATCGRAVGVSFQQFQKYEKGQNRISAGQLYTLAKLFDISVSSFLADIEKPRTQKNPIEMKQERKLLKSFSEIKDQKDRRLILGLVSSIKSQMREMKLTSVSNQSY